MKVYLIERNDSVSWDEFISCVVVAENKEDAIKQAFNFNHKFMPYNTEIKEVNLNKKQVILAHFNRGI